LLTPCAAAVIPFAVEPSNGERAGVGAATFSLSKLDTPMIREWRSTLLAGGGSTTMAAKAYRLLRAVLTTADKEASCCGSTPA
jgi:hypothetical protein